MGVQKLAIVIVGAIDAAGIARERSSVHPQRDSVEANAMNIFALSLNPTVAIHTIRRLRETLS